MNESNEISPIEKLREAVSNKPTTLDLVSELMNDNNIEMKTEITNPYALDTLMVFAQYLKKHKDKINAELLIFWKDTLLNYMVSNKRKSREEITEILKGYFALEQQKEKVGLTSNLATLNKQNNF